jgi:hypothetical protein
MQIIYYSLKGTNERIARQAASELGLASFRIEDVSSRQGLFGFLRSGFESVSRRCPDIRMPEGFQPDPRQIILLAPVWAGTISSPLRSFCTRYAGKFQSFLLVMTRLDPQKTYAEVKAEVEALTGANCRFYTSLCAKNLSSADIHELCRQLAQVDPA